MELLGKNVIDDADIKKKGWLLILFCGFKNRMGCTLIGAIRPPADVGGANMRNKFRKGEPKVRYE